MRYWIFVAAPQESDGTKTTARETFNRRTVDEFWGLGERTPNRKHVAKGDVVVFYLARPDSAFAGEAELASGCVEPDEETKERLSHGVESFRPDYGVYLSNIEKWDELRPVIDLADELEFIDDPRQWWVYLQGGVREISEADYQRIRRGSITGDRDTEEFERDSLFALESHLEEFIDQNWNNIDWGADLRQYQDGDQSGRQFPAGKWNIDFLAIDNRTNDFVVIELKRGQTGDATIGQVLRYIGWVKENLAEEGQKVRGIIVAKDVEDAIRYGVRSLGEVDVAVKTYSVTFTLNSVSDLRTGAHDA